MAPEPSIATVAIGSGVQGGRSRARFCPALPDAVGARAVPEKVGALYCRWTTT
jgi:hypothetical protein